MGLKFTGSVDGEERADVRVTLRLTREELAEIKRLARKDKSPWRAWLYNQCASGLYGAVTGGDAGRYEQHYGEPPGGTGEGADDAP